MSVPAHIWVNDATALETLGQAIVASTAGAVTGYEVEFSELSLTGPAGRVVDALTQLRDHPGWRFIQLIG